MADVHDHDIAPDHGHTITPAPPEVRTPEHDGGAGLASALGNQRVGQVLGSGVQRAGATGAQQLDETVARTIEERRGRGQPLDKGVRRDMETNLGTDLSDVRVHTDSSAHELNESVNARAFTTGNDVFFKQGTYDPASSSGRELLGHELTHVVQQRAGASGLESGQVSHPSDPAEQHAEAVGRSLGTGAATPAPAAGTPAVARQEEEEELQAAREPGVARQAMEEEEEVQASREPGTVVAREGEEEEELQAAREPGTIVAREGEEELEEGV